MKFPNIQITVLTLFLSLFLFNSCKNSTKKTENDDSVTGQYEAQLTDAPYVPAPASYDQPEKVIVNLEVKEQVMRLADGVEYNFWTFGGKVPGKFIKIRDRMEK